ncbi:hypothetical protein [Bacillus sp. S10(2024)]|uniref:hypothetical protein n=1 Tax=Bacillus sp. S10(2024) TaxID=3162886 RepID=UPI003D1C5A51
MNNDLLKKKIEKFAYTMMDKYFEKPEDNRYWRQQLNIKFRNGYSVWFGNLYNYGGKSVTIEWDSELSFRIQINHLPKEIALNIEKEFYDFVIAIKNNCDINPK